MNRTALELYDLSNRGPDIEAGLAEQCRGLLAENAALRAAHLRIFPDGVTSFDALRAWAEEWAYATDIARQVRHLFEEWDYRVRESDELQTINVALRAVLAKAAPFVPETVYVACNETPVAAQIRELLAPPADGGKDADSFKLNPGGQFS